MSAARGPGPSLLALQLGADGLLRRALLLQRGLRGGPLARLLARAPVHQLHGRARRASRGALRVGGPLRLLDDDVVLDVELVVHVHDVDLHALA